MWTQDKQLMMAHSIYRANKANQTTLLVSRPPVFIFLCGRAGSHYLLWHFEGVVSWNRPNN